MLKSEIEESGNKIKSFGCSFIFGSDLADTESEVDYSTLTWPAQLAKKLKMDYSCHAWPGSGNMRILESVLSQAADGNRDLYIIGWSWIDRFDYTDTQDSWKTILPVDTTTQADFYYRNLHSQYRDKLMTLICMRTAIDVLTQKQIPFIMTYMDELTFETEWHTTPAVTDLQQQIRDYMTAFEGKTFLEWSRDKNYPISKTLHPLEAAHNAGAKYMFAEIKKYMSKQLR
jgi:hypothetical protein